MACVEAQTTPKDAEAPTPSLRRVARRVSGPAIPARIGPVVFRCLGRWVAIRCPPEYATLMRRAGGTWEPGKDRWLIHVRRIGPVLRVLRRVTVPLFRPAGIDLDGEGA